MDNKTPLYHCLYKDMTGAALLATCERSVNGISGKFLFAATHLTKSLAFAFSYHDGEAMGNGAIKNTENEFVILRASKTPLEQERHITVLSFKDDEFISLGEGTRQKVSSNELPFEKTTIILETSDYKDLMRKGLQIFVFDDQKYPEDSPQSFFDYINHFSTMESGFAHFLNNGTLHWINADENIGLCKTFYARIFDENKNSPSYYSTNTLT